MARSRPVVSGVLEAPVRIRYFHGRMLSAEDLSREQEYHLRARRRLALLALGSGVVAGLRIGSGATKGRVVVSPGIAIDGLGREIVVPEEVELSVQGSQRFIVLSYAEELIEPTASHGDSTGVEHGAVRETFRLSASASRPAPDDPGGAISIGIAPVRPGRKVKKGAGRRARE